MNLPPKKPAVPAPQPGADDPLIPVLTERLGLPPLDFDTTLPLIESTGQGMEPILEGLTSLPEPPPPPRPPVSVPRIAPIPAPAGVARSPEPVSSTSARDTVNVLGAGIGDPLAASRAGNDGRHWARIELELRTSILREITDRLPRDVEEIVRRQMDAAIGRLVAALTVEARLAIAASVQEAVEHAVRAELERLRNSNRGSP